MSPGEMMCSQCSYRDIEFSGMEKIVQFIRYKM